MVLAGCDTASSGGSQIESMGMAQAFVTAGSETVIATTRPVEDSTARLFVESFYEGFGDGESPLEAYRLALARVAGQDGDWAAFRLMRP